MGRLKPGWTDRARERSPARVEPGRSRRHGSAGLRPALIEGYRRLRFGVVPAGRGVSRLRDAHGASLSLLLGLTGLVLLMTCGNLATLMLARASARGREIAVRVAIGASRARLVSQMLIESLLVAAAGAVLALPVALLSAARWWRSSARRPGRSRLTSTVDWRLMTFVGATATVTAVLFGLLPALRVSVVDPLAVMRQARAA